jgi:two-component system, chemotaxis family, chemotaxis protein CheY
MQTNRVLLVDDSPEFLASTQRYLQARANVEVVGVAGSGEEAVQKAFALHPDLVLMDLYLPGINGIEATRQIKNRFPKMRIVVFTFYDLDEYSLAARAAGAEELVPKSRLADEFSRLLENFPMSVSDAGPDSSAQILVVDDSPTVRKMVITALRPLGAGFVEAGNGLEAIEQLALNEFAAMTLDLNMPDVHGLEVLTYMRKAGLEGQVQVLVLTTRDDIETLQTAQSLGAARYLTKPFTPDQLLSTMRELLR